MPLDNLTNLYGFIRRWLSDPSVEKAVTVAVGILIISAIVRFLRRVVINRYIQDANLRYHARKVVAFSGYFVAVLFVASVLSDRFPQLTVALGIAGAGVAFALQEVIMSIAGWVAIVFGSFYRTGDRIQLGGIKGDVIDIGVFRTTLMECGEWVNTDLYNGRIVRQANSFVFKEPVFNYSDDFPFLWDEITLPVKFGSDHSLAREILQNIADKVVGKYATYAKKSWRDVVRKYMIDDASVIPTVTMVFNENWMDFTLRYVVDYKERRATKDRLFTWILEAFEKTEGRVAIAPTSTDINLTDAPIFNVRFPEK